MENTSNLNVSYGMSPLNLTGKGMLMAPYVAEKFIVSTPGQEIIGQIAMSNFQSVMSSEIQPLLEKHGLVDVRPDQWILHQKVMDLYRDIESGKTNIADNLVAIGKKGADNIVLPPEVNTLDILLGALNLTYQMNVRPVAEGEGYIPKRMGDGHYHVITNSPYPQDLMYGFLWGLVNRLRPQNAAFTVRIVENPHPDTEPGIVFDIEWAA